jgi:hypothetical protein
MPGFWEKPGGKAREKMDERRRRKDAGGKGEKGKRGRKAKAEWSGVRGFLTNEER